MHGITVQLVDACDEKFPGLYFFIISTESHQGELATLANIPLDNVRELTWFNEKIESIKNDILPISRECGVSIAKSIKDYYLLNDVDEVVIDKLYAYRESHGLRFAFRGRDIPDIYIGKIDDGYQISCSDTGLEFCYDFDINKFMSLIDNLLSRSYRSHDLG